MFEHIIIFILGLAALVKGADLFVEYSARIAKRLGVSDLVIGLTLTSIGTSIPELASSLSASLNMAPELVIGNIVGSNIANIGLILGVAALFHAIPTDEKMHDRDGIIMIACTALFFGLVLNNSLVRWEGIALLCLYVFYIFFAVISSVQERSYHFKDFMQFILDFEYIEPFTKGLKKSIPMTQKTHHPEPFERFPARKLAKEFLVVIASIALIVFGAKYLIEEALWIAKVINIPENVVGLTMIAMGTSLPELVVSITAAKKGKGGIVVGNIIGSNIANILLIGGLASALSPLHVAEDSVTYTIPIMLFFSLFLLYCVKTDWRISRAQGLLLVFVYLAFIISAF